MANLILENVPNDIYECLRLRAAAGQRSVPDETVYLLQQILYVDEHSQPVPETTATNPMHSTVDDADEPDEERPWRGVFAPPRPSDTLFLKHLDVRPASLPKRLAAVNMSWHRMEPDDV